MKPGLKAFQKGVNSYEAVRVREIIADVRASLRKLLDVSARNHRPQGVRLVAVLGKLLNLPKLPRCNSRLFTIELGCQLGGI